MSQKILIVGGGFAGLWSALGAARVLDNNGGSADVDITLISPEPLLHLRPRLHEQAPHGMTTPLLPVLEAAGVRYLQGSVERIDAGERRVDTVTADGQRQTLNYDRLVLTTGSKLHRPAVPGIEQHAHSVDQLDEAVRLDLHLARLADLPPSAARNTVVIVGGGFTGIEVATEMPERLRKVFGQDARFNVIVVDRGGEIGAELGAGPRPAITQAFRELGVEAVLSTAVTAVDADGVTTSDGQRIEANTVIWTGGMRASALTEQLPAQRDVLGRVRTDRDLRVAGAADVFAAGDVALAQTDDEGNHALMSCQHAIDMGRYAGHNVAADLLGLPTLHYKQPFYVTCLDLGAWGAVYTEGWQREVKMAGADAKALKVKINTQWILPPLASRSATLAAADPQRSVVA